MSDLNTTTIHNIKQIANNAFIISIKRNFEFIAGQIIGITHNKELAPRLYSICSGPNEKYISILFSIKADGQLTPPLAKAKAGDTIYYTKPQGKFTFDNKPAWWIATGTGIAPFRSMLENKQQPLKLIQGGRQVNDFYFREAFEALPDYIKCCSQEHGEGIYSGRLTHYLKEQKDLPTNINYYLCGSAEMVVDVRNLLISKNVAYSNIITEIYF